jgi:uncharacterized Zn-binding protein involved in type VI secretion
MPTEKAARIGDEGSHGGFIITGSDVTSIDGRKAARIGDIYDCEIDGPNPIVTGSDVVIIDGKPAARIGSLTECGAVIITGSDVTSDI